MAAPRRAAIGVGSESGCRGAAPDDEVSALADDSLHEVTMAPGMEQSVARWNVNGDLFLGPVVLLAV